MAKSKPPSVLDATAPRAVVGAIAGFIATEAMTVAAAEMFRRLPRHELSPLPPREITDQLFRFFGNSAPSNSARVAATLVNHFAFGAAAGAVYYLLPKWLRTPPSSVGYACVVWAGSYFGWVPMFNFLAPASRHPARRNALMVAAHLVWGAALWSSGELLARSLSPLQAGPAVDARRRHALLRRIA